MELARITIDMPLSWWMPNAGVYGRKTRYQKEGIRQTYVVAFFLK
jgi:hypothetical protein